MRHFFYCIFVVQLLVSCQAKEQSNNEAFKLCDWLWGHLSKMDDLMEKRKTAMWDEMCSSPTHLSLSGDSIMKAHDPHAYWLLNNLLQLSTFIQSPVDCWAWMLNMDDCVAMYNERLGREIGSPKLAITAMEELAGDAYGSGSQAGLNSSTYIYSILDYYKTILLNRRLLECIDLEVMFTGEDVTIRDLAFKEFCGWQQIIQTSEDIMTNYTYSEARYTASTMEMNETFHEWVLNRQEQLNSELSLIFRELEGPYMNELETISENRFTALIDRFKVRYKPDVMDSYLSYLKGWQQVREQITLLLAVDKRRSYRALTNQQYSAFYHILESLEEQRY